MHQFSLVAQTVKSMPAVWRTWIRTLGRNDPLEKRMATHSSILAWRTLQREDPGRPQSMGLHQNSCCILFKGSWQKENLAVCPGQKGAAVCCRTSESQAGTAQMRSRSKVSWWWGKGYWNSNAKPSNREILRWAWSKGAQNLSQGSGVNLRVSFAKCIFQIFQT